MFIKNGQYKRRNEKLINTFVWQLTFFSLVNYNLKPVVVALFSPNLTFDISLKRKDSRYGRCFWAVIWFVLFFCKSRTERYEKRIDSSLDKSMWNMQNLFQQYLGALSLSLLTKKCWEERLEYVKWWQKIRVSFLKATT